MQFSSIRTCRFSRIVILPLLFFGLTNLAESAEPAKSDESTKEQTILIISGSAIDLINERQIQRYFTLQKKLLPDNASISLFRLPMGDTTTLEFSNRVFGFYPYQLQRIWDRQVYSGKAKPPAVANDENELIQQIASTPHALGYISTSTPIPEELKGKINVIASF